MNLLVINNNGEGAVYTVISDEYMDKIINFDVKRKHHITGFEYIHSEDRKNYALELLGLSKDKSEPIGGDNIVPVFKNTLTKLPEHIDKCSKVYIL